MSNLTKKFMSNLTKKFMSNLTKKNVMGECYGPAEIRTQDPRRVKAMS